MSAPQVQLGDNKVGQMGFGLMQLTWNPQPPSQEDSFRAMKAAVDAGCNAWSTAMFYGNFMPNSPEKMLDNMRLIAAFFEKYPEYKDKVTLIVKGGVTNKFGMTLDLDWHRKQIKETREILKDKKIDIYSMSRIPPGTTAEDVGNTLKTLRDEGHFDHIGLSEVNAKTIDTINKIVPVAVVEIEVSLWSFEEVIRDVVDYSKQNKIPILAYSPLGRGFLSRKWKSPEDIPEGAFQKTHPRFQGETFYENLKLVDQMDEVAEGKGVKTTQLALAWLTNLSPYVIPIPGSSNPGRIQENADAVNIKFTDDDLKGLNETLQKFEPSGGRYGTHGGDLQMK